VGEERRGKESEKGEERDRKGKTERKKRKEKEKENERRPLTRLTLNLYTLATSLLPHKGVMLFAILPCGTHSLPC